MRRAEDFSVVNRWFLFGVLMTPYIFYAFLFNTEVFLRPYIAESLGLSKTQVAAFYTAQAIGAIIGSIVLSQLADRTSRRNTYAAIAVLLGIAALSITFVDSYQLALLHRFAMGFFLGGMFGCAVSLYMGLFPPYQTGLLAGLVQLVYNGGDAILSWTGRHFDAESWRTVIEIGGVGAITTGVAVFLFLPGDKSYSTWGGASDGRAIETRFVQLAELFHSGRWRLTLRLVLLCGLNFLGFQSFNAWTTTYLREDQAYSPDLVGKLLTILHIGSMLGALFWGWVADTAGRRANAIGFLICAVSIVFYLTLAPSPMTFAIVGFVFGVGLVSSGIWGPYFAELYPVHLRATAASIFNWGRIFSLFGALLTGLMADTIGLRWTMMSGSLIFLLGAVIWWTLPETLNRPSNPVNS